MTLPEEPASIGSLEEEIFPGIWFRADEQFRLSSYQKLEFPFTLTLTNTSTSKVEIQQWAVTMVSANQGNGTSSFSRVPAEPATIAPGESHSLNGYLYLGPYMGSRHSEKWIAKAVGRSESQLPMTASERSNGDCLIGLRMNLSTSAGKIEDTFLVKYHYDESQNRLTPYQIMQRPTVAIPATPNVTPSL